MKFPEFETSFGPISPSIVSAVEQGLSLRLPKSYKLFLSEINGGKPKNPCFIMGDNWNCVRDFFGIRDDGYNFIHQHISSLERIPQNMVPLAEDHFGNRIILSTKGPDHGKVYFWDHEQETEPADYSNLTLIADSFEEFINNLKSDEEIEELKKS